MAHISTKFLLPLIAAAFLLSFPAAYAAPGNLPPFRADDTDIFAVEDNPAKLALMSSQFRLGFAYTPVNGSSNQNFDLAAVLPYLCYGRYSWSDTASSYALGLGFNLDKSGWAAAGVNYVYNGSKSATIGLLVRPASFSSLGLSAVCAENGDVIWGLGLGFRPLAFMGGSGSALTFTADADYAEASGFTLESVGIRAFMPGLGSIRGWYAFDGWNRALASDRAASSIGIELTLAVDSTSEFSASVADAASALDGDVKYRVADTAIIDMKNLGHSASISSGGDKVLLIDNIDAVTAVPMFGGDGMALNNTKAVSFAELLARVDAARTDKNIVAVAFKDLPPLPGIAYYDEFNEELALLRRTGRHIYLYGSSFGREIAYLSINADKIFLNPNGEVNLRGFSYRRLYLKPLLDKFGIRVVNLAPWDTKSAYNNYSFDTMPAGEREMMERFYKGLQQNVLDSLGTRGRLKTGAIQTLENGPYVTSADALEAGLVDAVCYADEFEDNLERDFNKAAIVKSIEKPRDQYWGADAFAKHIAVVWLSGDIIMGRGIAGAQIGSLALDEIANLRSDPEVNAVIIRMDSPGGASVMSDEIAREVRRTVEAGKLVVVSMGAYAASGGYFISAPASRIFADKTTLTGSIGVTAIMPNFSGSLEKLGLHYDGFDLSPGSSMMDPLKPVDEADSAKLSKSILFAYDQFISTVASGRRMDREKVKAIAEGRIWLGSEAVENGLVDEIGSLSDAQDYVAQQLGGRVVFDNYVPGDVPSFLESFFNSSAAASLGLGPRPLEKMLSPLEKKISELSALGSGPLYYLDTDSIDL